MVAKPHGANHVKLNLSFMVLDTNRRICICFLICFWSNNTQMFLFGYNICRQGIAFSFYADDTLIFLHLKPNSNNKTRMGFGCLVHVVLLHIPICVQPEVLRKKTVDFLHFSSIYQLIMLHFKV